MGLAQRNLLQNKTRLILSIVGVALAVMLILLLGGFSQGMNRQISAYLDRSPGTLVVAQEGVRNLLGATSLLPPSTADAAAQAQGVDQVVPILSQFVILDLHEKKQPAYLIGYDPVRGGGPWKISAGREPHADDEVVFDRILAQRHGIVLGDTVAILDRDFRVVGLSEGTSSWMTSFFFMSKSAAEQLLRAPGATSFLLVRPSRDTTAQAVQSRLSALPGIEALEKKEMAENDLRLFTRFFNIPIRLMTGIAFLVGALIVGLVVYTATVERQREYGVLKAVGARNRVLFQLVTVQALVITLVGAVVGVGLAAGGAQLMMALRPQFLIVLEPGAVGLALLAGLAMALLAALFPARVVAGLAPADVFRR